MQITRDNAKHLYTVDGIRFDGVTSVINRTIRKPPLETWIGNLGNREAARQRDAAGDHGTLVHSLAALRVEGIPSISMGDEAATERQLGAFAEWYDETVAECYGVEMFVAHPTYRYAGALDFLVRLVGDKVPTVVDVKSGKSIYPEMALQTSAYREAALQNILPALGFKNCRRGVLHIPLVGKLKFTEHTDHQGDFQGFLSALYLYRHLHFGGN